MKKAIQYLLFGLICTSCTNMREDKMIERIELVSLKWNIVTRVALTPESIWNVSEAFHTTIEDRAYLDNFDSRLTSFKKNQKNREVSENIDVRISCLLYRENALSDTISFGRVGLMMFDNKCYSFNKSLLAAVLEKLPTSHQEIVKAELNLDR